MAVQASTEGYVSKLKFGVLVALIALLALGQLLQGWQAWQHESGQLGRAGSEAGNSLCGVMLVNGQIYYGTLVEVTAGYVKLADVYYVQSVPQPNGGVANRLVNRQKNDWHGPKVMVIPSDKVLYFEPVGAKSQLAGLVEQDRNAAPTTPAR